jgi:hypothetical protein
MYWLAVGVKIFEQFVERRHLTAALSSADPYILFIFNHETCRQLFTQKVK